MATKKIKSDVSFEQNISLPNKTASRALKIDSSGNISESTVTEAQLEALPQEVIDAQADATQAIADAAAAQSKADQNESDIVTVDGKADQGIADAATAQAAADAAQADADTANSALSSKADLVGGKVPADQLPNAIMEYQGNYDAATNTPTLADGVGNADNAIGNTYRVAVAGSQDLGSGTLNLVVGEYLILNSSKIWERSAASDAVTSVAGKTGVVSLDTLDLTHEQSIPGDWTVANFSTAAEHINELSDRIVNGLAAIVQADGSVTTHNDVTSAGSGEIITSGERDIITKIASDIRGYDEVTENTTEAISNISLDESTVRGFEGTITLSTEFGTEIYKVMGVFSGTWQMAIESVGPDISASVLDIISDTGFGKIRVISSGLGAGNVVEARSDIRVTTA